MIVCPVIHRASSAARMTTEALDLSAGLGVIRLAERFVGTVRRECLDWIVILRRRHLVAVRAEFVDHYNRHRPNRGLGLRAPGPRHSGQPEEPRATVRDMRRRDRLGVLINEYERAA